MESSTTRIDTGRLVLVRLSLDHTDFIRTLLNQPSFLANIGDRGVRTDGDAQTYLTNGPMFSYARNGFGLYLVSLKEHGVPIGICGLVKRVGLPDPDIGYAFLPEYWSQGYATEAAQAVLIHAKSALGINRVVGIVNPDNAPSIRVLQRIGLTFECMITLPPDVRELMLFGPPA